MNTFTSQRPYLLGIDQGSSGSRALILDHEGLVCGYGYRPLPSIYPRAGWVEQDPQVVAATVAEAITEAVGRARCQPGEIAACGIACQRNTDFVWDARSRKPLANAISWQDLRTIPMIEDLTAWPQASETRRRLGYAPGPYSSALHLAWRMHNDPILAKAARSGFLRVGLSAAWLLAALGQPVAHLMDYSLVQAMGLYDFRAQQYWDEWLGWLGVPREPLPEPVPTVNYFGEIEVSTLNGDKAQVPVMAMIGDQQSALFGYDCRRPGEAECTHGTASFVDVFLGKKAPESEKVNIYYAWHLGDQPTYCLEADTTVTGAAIRWMRQSLRLFDRDEEIGTLSASVPDSAGVVFVPAFTGLNVPYNDHDARGSLVGLTLAHTRAHVARAFLESIGLQVRAILETIATETGVEVKQLNLGGGISASDEACRIMADMLGIPTVRPAFAETTARAAGLLAGLGAGVWKTSGDLPPLPDRYDTFEPRWSLEQRESAYARWNKAVNLVRAWGRGN